MALTLTTFVPGTKAKADEVNANFSAIQEELEKKAAIDGDNTQKFSVADATEKSHAVNKSQLDEKSTELIAEINKTGTKFCVKSGNTTNGAGNLFTYNVYELIAKIGGTYDDLVIVDYTGLQTVVSETPKSINLTGNANGEYNIFIKPDGGLYVLDNTIYRQPKRPTMVVGDVWLNTSVEPFECIKYSGSSDIEFLDVPLGTVTLSNNVITSVTTFPFNQNGYNINANTAKVSYKYDYAHPVAKNTGVTYTAETNGLLFIRHANINDTIAVTLDGFYYVLGWSSSQGSSSSNLIPIAKGQTYLFSGGELRYFIPEIKI